MSTIAVIAIAAGVWIAALTMIVSLCRASARLDRATVRAIREAREARPAGGARRQLAV